ncbi:hypothetical protein GALMADRAFT_210202 [Galerina marginata CBS 339.88]|uniref:Uncharacterized protein n=1 Tax=Galerina marginata (strain CBS 339.88) TaxID=685588 RepID=A0A067TAY1_GALM3|nr:hypothetical protein GALMADRAFT_210202 [Galerina marginata CBS 339.88]
MTMGSSYEPDTVFPLPNVVLRAPFCRQLFDVEQNSCHPPLTFPYAYPERRRGRQGTELIPSGCGEPLIPKPFGQAGYPGRGGYNLQHTLGWPPHKYYALQDRIRFHTGQRSLCVGLPISKQPHQTIVLIQDEARTQFDLLSKYENNWPSRDMISTFLSNKSLGKKKEL